MSVVDKLVLIALCIFVASCSNEVSNNVSSSELVMKIDGKLPEFFQCVREGGFALISAHRGGPSENYPENAIETFEYTTDKATVIVELDVVETRDGALMVHHDNMLDRTTTLNGAVKSKDWEQLSFINLKGTSGKITDFNPVTLGEALNWAKDKALLQIDMKPPVKVADVADAVLQANAAGRVLYIAYSVSDAEALLNIVPNAVVSLGISNRQELEEIRRSSLPMHLVHGLVNNVENRTNFIEELHMNEVTVVGLAFDIANESSRPGNDLPWSVVMNSYKKRVGSGTDILASNKPIDVYNALYQNTEFDAKLKACIEAVYN